MRLSNLQLEALLERYRRQAKRKTLTQFGRDVAAETVAALEDLQRLRRAASVPLEGTVR